MTGGKPIIYWDACSFLALIKQENSHGPAELAALQNQANDFDSGLLLLASSAIVVLEVLSAELTPDQILRFEGVIDRSNFIPVDANDSVMRVAAEIRRYYHGKIKDGAGKSMIVSAPDAIHIASAVKIEAESLITLDSKNKPKDREAGMIQVGALGNILGRHVISIQRPSYGSKGDLFKA